MKKRILFLVLGVAVLAGCGEYYEADPTDNEEPPECIVLQHVDEGFLTDDVTGIGVYCQADVKP